MGNSASARYQTVRKLRQELNDLEQKLQAVQAVQRKEVIALEHRLHKLSEEKLNTRFSFTATAIAAATAIRAHGAYNLGWKPPHKA